MREYYDTLTRDLAGFELVDSACSSGDASCKAAISADGALAKKAHDDIGALYAEPAGAQAVIEDIRQELWFAPGVAQSYDGYSRADDVSFMDGIVKQIQKDMAQLRAMV